MNKLNKTLLGLSLVGVSLVGTAFFTETAAHAQADVTVGSLRGVIRDKGVNNDAAVGATVVATSPALQGEQVVITDENGQYFINALPAGLYTLTVYYQDNTFTRANVLIQTGKEAVVNVGINTASAAKKGETIVIKGTVPIIDQGSQKTGVTITDDYTRNIPVGRTFGAVLGAAAGSQNDQYGTSISGSTSVENTYIVEGMNTTDAAFGLQASNLPNEFVNETEVITGGYNAEYGRATGGIVNVVTKSGSNEFHGSVFAYVSPGALTSAARVVSRGGGSVDNVDNVDVAYDIGAELGGPIIKDHLWFHLGFNPNRTQATDTRSISSLQDVNQDGVADVDASGNVIKTKVASQDFSHATTTYYFTGKLSGEINANNQFSISAFGNPTRAKRTTLTNADVFSAQDPYFGQDEGAIDLTAKYTSKLNEGKTQIDAIAGVHRAYDHSYSDTASGALSSTEYQYTRSLYDFADIETPGIEACNDNAPGNPYKKITLCPVTNYVENGLGLLENRKNDRWSGALTLTQRVKLLGYHVFKGGIDIETSIYDTTQGYPGGAFMQRRSNIDPNTGLPVGEGQGLPGRWVSQGFDVIERNLTPDEVNNPPALGPDEAFCNNGLSICKESLTHKADTSDRSIGAFLQDSWQILPNLTVDVGVRFEQQVAFNAKQFQGTTTATGEIVPDAAFTLNNWAPRLGFNWDPTNEGKSKIFGHFGRFYENIPLDINVRAFGGEIDNELIYNLARTAPGAPGYDPNCNVDHGTPDPGAAIKKCSDKTTILFGEGGESAAPGLKGQYTQEFIGGGEFELLPDFKIGLTYTHRTLPTIIEDVSANDGGFYVIANPGVNYDTQAADLLSKAAAEKMSNPGQAAYDTTEAQALSFLKKEDPPSRTYDALTITLQQRPTHQSLLIASYTYSREVGNYPGLYSTETGQLDPNLTSQYDLPELVGNRYGKMGLDRPHLLKVDGFYNFDLKRAGLVTVGASFRLQSGIPHNALGLNTDYDQEPGEAYVLPRGSFERSPVTEELDLKLQYGRRLGKGMTLTVFGDVFNLFNQQEELTTDESYTFDFVNPIIGGNQQDLQHLKTTTQEGVNQNITPTKNPDFGHSSSYSAPRSFRFGARLSF